MMEKLFILVLMVCLTSVSLVAEVQAQATRSEIVTPDEALVVCQNWVTLVTEKRGSWGGVENTEVVAVQEFEHSDRLLGYFCQVKPWGYVVVSLRKELEPVKVYSESSNLDPASGEGMAGLIKGSLERILNAVEAQVGPVATARTTDIESILEINYSQAWEALSSDPGRFAEQMTPGAPLANYQQGQLLLESSWHQGDPYWDLTPWGDGGQTLVGCVATAGAQIMKYWAWPPYGVGTHSYTWDNDDSCNDGSPTPGGTLTAAYSDVYDWRHIANRYVWDSWQNRWEDENGDPLAQADLDAVAELGYEVGVAVNMDYGACVSGASTSDMEDVYENHYRYHTNCVKQSRGDYTAVAWFERIKAQINVNRPLQYAFRVSPADGGGGHSIVADGWQEFGDPLVRQYHMNYGWDDSHNAWYTLDALAMSDPNEIDEEYMLENIYPARALGNVLFGTYARDASFPFRYFDQDATGSSVAFSSGQNLQFLPGIVVRCNSTTGDSIRIYGASTLDTRLFARGDMSRGVVIHNGAIELNQNGNIQLP